MLHAFDFPSPRDRPLLSLLSSLLILLLLPFDSYLSELLPLFGCFFPFLEPVSESSFESPPSLAWNTCDASLGALLLFDVLLCFRCAAAVSFFDFQSVDSSFESFFPSGLFDLFHFYAFSAAAWRSALSFGGGAHGFPPFLVGEGGAGLPLFFFPGESESGLGLLPPNSASASSHRLFCRPPLLLFHCETNPVFDASAINTGLVRLML